MPSPTLLSQLPTSSWNEYREALALHLEIYEWRVTASAYHVVNDLNWHVLTAAALPEPKESRELRDAWRAVRLAMEALDSLTEPRGAFGYTGYADEGELEQSIWGESAKGQ